MIRCAPVGHLLRSWRTRRRLSQLELATASTVSQRHLSWLESGKAMPSREMILRLSKHLAIPHRERNALLVAGGFAPIYRERSLEEPAMAPLLALVQRVLAGHEPFPALAVNRRWELLWANAGLLPLMKLASARLLTPPVNVLRLSLHPDGLAPHIVNYEEWRDHLITRLLAQREASADVELTPLIDELRSYPTRAGARVEQIDTSLSGIAVPLELRAGDGRVLRFLSCTTVFGTPVDVTLSELAIEAFLPADAETAAHVLAQAQA
jgi:transcriptional regulator with XRE-family HTH domain